MSGTERAIPGQGPEGVARFREALAHGSAEPSPDQQARRRLAAATRQLIDELVTSTAPAGAAGEAAALVEAAVALLGGHQHGRAYDAFAESAVAGDPSSFLDFSPIVGPQNPLAPPLVVRTEGDAVVGHGRFGAAYEGPPGCVHGGYLAAAFDEVLGFVQSLTGKPGMTGRLTIRYRQPTPLHQDLRFEGRVDRVEGRKIFTTATLHHGDTLTAEAEGLFISIDWETFRALMDQRPAP